jgi:biotin--protein ligase
MPLSAFVYSGPGAGSRSVLSALLSLRQALQPHVQVETLGTEALLEGHWLQSCVVLIIPGGADLPYCRHLDGAGTRLIRRFVEDGGAFVGLCAGAYFASSRVEFEPDSPLEVVGDRELAFFPGTARGSVFPGFDYASERGAVAAALSVRGDFGGISSPADWWMCDDYANGGPAFELSSGAVLAAEAPVEGVTLLATYDAERDHAAAAVACRVGQGCAVLCGTHPELPHGWLAPAAWRADAVGGEAPAQDAAHAAHVARLREQLEASGAGRWRLWRTLLTAAALEGLLREDTGAPTCDALPAGLPS